MALTFRKPPMSFWIIGGLLLLWHLIGGALYLTAAEREALELTPLWATAAYGIAVWGGLLAAVTLLLRSRLATPLFLLSVIAGAFRLSYDLAHGLLSSPADWLMPLLVLAVGIFAVWYSRSAARKGFLR